MSRHPFELVIYHRGREVDRLPVADRNHNPKELATFCHGYTHGLLGRPVLADDVTWTIVEVIK